MTKFRIAALLSTVAAVGFAHGALASTPDQDIYEVRKETVRFADLDVSQERGARTLLRRLRSASARVCGGSGRLSETKDYRECREQAIADAVKATRSPMLAAIYGDDPNPIVLAKK